VSDDPTSDTPRPDGSGDWQTLVAADDPFVVAAGVAHAFGHAQVLVPTHPKPSRVTDDEWTLVRAPTVDRAADGTTHVELWIGGPPVFAPERLTIVVPPQGMATIERTQASALVAPSTRTAALIAAVRNHDEKLGQVAAAEALGEERVIDAVDALVALLAESTWIDARRAAALALGRIGDGATLPRLADALAGADDPDLVRDLLSAIASFDPSLAIPALHTAATSTTSDSVRAKIEDRIEVLS
jgi:hypothetical protein